METDVKPTFKPPLTISHEYLVDDGGDDTFRESLYLMVVTFSRLETCREAFGRFAGLTGTQFAVMMGVSYRQKEEGVTIRALADYIQLASTHVTTEVGSLIKKGYLQKRMNQQDRRSVLVSLTPKGEELIRQITPFVKRVNDALFEGVSKKELASVSAVLKKITLNSEFALAEIRRTQLERESL